MLESKTYEMISPEEFPLRLTPKAVEMAKQALSESAGEEGETLRISVRGGGCAGMQYSLSFVSDSDELDLVTSIDGLKVATDVFSSTTLSGTEVDYVDSLEGAGFKFNNPTAKRTCGCGSSFSG